MLIKNNKTGVIHKAIIKGDYRLKLVGNNLPTNLKYYNSLCGFIKEDNKSNIDFMDKDDSFINCYFCLKKMNLK